MDIRTFLINQHKKARFQNLVYDRISKCVRQSMENHLWDSIWNLVGYDDDLQEQVYEIRRRVWNRYGPSINEQIKAHFRHPL